MVPAGGVCRSSALSVAAPARSWVQQPLAEPEGPAERQWAGIMGPASTPGTVGGQVGSRDPLGADLK